MVLNMVLNEVNILYSLSHYYLIKLEGVIKTTTLLHIVLAFAEDIQLFDKIIDQTKLNKDKTKLDFY